MEESIKKRVEKFDGMHTEDILEYISTLRFGGTPILINRVIHEFAYFVGQSIFDNKSKEYALVSAYGLVSKQNNEAARCRMWAIMFAIFYEDDI